MAQLTEIWWPADRNTAAGGAAHSRGFCWLPASVSFGTVLGLAEKFPRSVIAFENMPRFLPPEFFSDPGGCLRSAAHFCGGIIVFSSDEDRTGPERPCDGFDRYTLPVRSISDVVALARFEAASIRDQLAVKGLAISIEELMEWLDLAAGILRERPLEQNTLSSLTEKTPFSIKQLVTTIRLFPLLYQETDAQSRRAWMAHSLGLPPLPVQPALW